MHHPHDQDNDIELEDNLPPLRILFATEYLPPFVSGIANRCKNLINGYRQEGHHVTVFSVHGTDCDIIVPSIVNPFYAQQRVFLFPPLPLLRQLLDFTQPVPYDIAHIVAPLCFSFVFILPLLKLRGIKIYVSYHVFLEYYKNQYVGAHPVTDFIIYTLFTMLYYLPLVWLAECVGIPSKTADTYVFKYSQRIHHLRSGLDTNVFVPQRVAEQVDVDGPVYTSNTKDDGNGGIALSSKIADGSSSSDSRTSSASSRSSLNLHKVIETPSMSSDRTVSDLRLLSGLVPASSGPLLIYVGRLALEKNVEFLVQAMGHPSMDTATLVIVGDGPSRQGLLALASEVVGSEYVYSPALFVVPATVADQTTETVHPIIKESTTVTTATATAATTEEVAVSGIDQLSASTSELLKSSASFSPSETDSVVTAVGATVVQASLETTLPISNPDSHHAKTALVSTIPMTPFPTRKRVIFTGMIFDERQVASYYGQCDLFVSASASETFGFTVAEAMACGTPAVVVRSGAFKTVYRMIDNWMFEEGDVDEYVQRVGQVFRHGVTSRRLARDIAVKGFGVKAAIRDLTKTYRWIVDGCPPGHQ
ncbi:hypothetical protein BASA50_007023 [Batrachochytrium salamandrivorans]|uniref:Glycosyltransferase subfamily 4-like N-terminal domain-containing protein n=1 Tax=Batrachochytrium salamandrivorans TaxID=1357716 RepID=A0ABQ8F899_9FUNG|nr:hypothetical protein BASA62_003092 [Batrachochytrium salamandrivorans]KAH6585176.1 hypothetical protein BASA61_007041 [Batrachochytrium salamandrivorans]KAH6593968.1 hypothetical protein BASA50_007023 [Batrachochytrium salamandrivorans]KAJ1336237.1 hypothetical protein BSLG_007465 [Batrachochytrium salamandrivorans]